MLRFLSLSKDFDHPPIHLIWFVVLVGVGVFSPQILLAVLALGYVISGILLRVTRWRASAEGANTSGSSVRGASETTSTPSSERRPHQAGKS